MKKRTINILIIVIITNICTGIGMYYYMQLNLAVYGVSTWAHGNITYTQNLETLLNSIILDLKNGDETTLQKLEKMQENLSPSYEGVELRSLVESSGLEWCEEISLPTNTDNTCKK